MSDEAIDTLDEAYERLHATGPEFEGWLSNHGPMVVEAMVRREHGESVHGWLDAYMRRLEPFPSPTARIDGDWEEALGDPRRIADWTAYFEDRLSDEPWRTVLNFWWPRLLPGVAAAATHGVIRVGHSVRALLADEADASHVAELAHGLAYWAARWQPVPGADTELDRRPPSEDAGDPNEPPEDALAALPRIADQSDGVRERLLRLADLPAWEAALRARPIPSDPDEIVASLRSLVEAAAVAYLYYGHGNGVMLVHSATAPNAILRTLPVLEQQLWRPSLAAAWAASAALTAVYAPASPAPRDELPSLPAGPEAAQEIFSRAVDHGDEHVIKFADTALDVYEGSEDATVLAAALRATELIER